MARQRQTIRKSGEEATNNDPSTRSTRSTLDADTPTKHNRGSDLGRKDRTSTDPGAGQDAGEPDTTQNEDSIPGDVGRTLKTPPSSPPGKKSSTPTRQSPRNKGKGTAVHYPTTCPQASCPKGNQTPPYIRKHRKLPAWEPLPATGEGSYQEVTDFFTPGDLPSLGIIKCFDISRSTYVTNIPDPPIIRVQEFMSLVGPGCVDGQVIDYWMHHILHPPKKEIQPKDGIDGYMPHYFTKFLTTTAQETPGPYDFTYTDIQASMWPYGVERCPLDFDRIFIPHTMGGDFREGPGHYYLVAIFIKQKKIECIDNEIAIGLPATAEYLRTLYAVFMWLYKECERVGRQDEVDYKKWKLHYARPGIPQQNSGDQECGPYLINFVTQIHANRSPEVITRPFSMELRKHLMVYHFERSKQSMRALRFMQFSNYQCNKNEMKRRRRGVKRTRDYLVFRTIWSFHTGEDPDMRPLHIKAIHFIQLSNLLCALGEKRTCDYRIYRTIMSFITGADPGPFTDTDRSLHNKAIRFMQMS
jgi:hypothetical protein